MTSDLCALLMAAQATYIMLELVAGSQFYKNIRTLLHVEIVNIDPCHDITYMSRYL